MAKIPTAENGKLGFLTDRFGGIMLPMAHLWFTIKHYWRLLLIWDERKYQEWNKLMDGVELREWDDF